MGTRADFYIGVGENAEWLGSVAFDGYEWAEEESNFIVLSKSADEFRINVNKMLSERDDATLPKDGWPWPWDDSKLTDFAYYFHGGKVGWEDQPVYPNMKDKKNVTLGKRSGLLVCRTTNSALILACHKTGRRFICIDREQKYIDIAQQRYADLIAQQELFGNQDARAGQGECPGTACNSGRDAMPLTLWNDDK